jgi:hypothetical protein
LSISSFQVECLRAEAIRGVPKYLEGREEVEKPRVLEIFL